MLACLEPEPATKALLRRLISGASQRFPQRVAFAKVEGAIHLR